MCNYCACESNPAKGADKCHVSLLMGHGHAGAQSRRETAPKNLPERDFLEEKSSKASCAHGHILSVELGSKLHQLLKQQHKINLKK